MRLLNSTGRKEMFYLTTHSTHFIYDYVASDRVKKVRLLNSTGRKEMFYLMTHSTHFIYDYMALDRVKREAVK